MDSIWVDNTLIGNTVGFTLNPFQLMIRWCG